MASVYRNIPTGVYRPRETYLSKHDVLPIEMWARFEGHKELATVGVLAEVRHRQQALLRMREKLLVLEIPPQVARDGSACIDRLAASAIPRSKISPLDHEISDDAMELRSFVSKPLLRRAQCAEVLASDGGFIVVQSEDQSILLAAVDRDDHERTNAAIVRRRAGCSDSRRGRSFGRRWWIQSTWRLWCYW